MGLGLAIVRRLCALLGHSLELTSIRARGSRFTIVVPRAASRSRCATSEQASPLAVGALFAARQIVVVDDDPAVVAAMRALFSSRGAKVAGGEDAPSALAVLRAGDANDRYSIEVRWTRPGSTVTAESREGFAVPPGGDDYYINDASTVNDEDAGAIGDNRHTGKTSGDPKANLLPPLRSYDLTLPASLAPGRGRASPARKARRITQPTRQLSCPPPVANERPSVLLGLRSKSPQID